MSLGKTVRELRKSAGLSQTKLAKKVGISVSYLSLIESGDREPTISVLRDIAGRLGAPTTILLAVALTEKLPPDTPERAIAERLARAARLNTAARAEPRAEA